MHISCGACRRTGRHMARWTREPCRVCGGSGFKYQDPASRQKLIDLFWRRHLEEQEVAKQMKEGEDAEALRK